MCNGDVTVLYADGAVSKMTDVPQGLNITQRPESAQVRSSSARSNREAQVTTPTKRGNMAVHTLSLPPLNYVLLDAQKITFC